MLSYANVDMTFLVVNADTMLWHPNLTTKQMHAVRNASMITLLCRKQADTKSLTKKAVCSFRCQVLLSGSANSTLQTKILLVAQGNAEHPLC